MKYTYGGILVTICLLVVAFSYNVYAQATNFTTLFDNQAHHTACEKYGSKICYSPLDVRHESVTSMIVGVREGTFGLIGDELDELTKAGYKIHSFVPDADNMTRLYEQWIYLTKP